MSKIDKGGRGGIILSRIKKQDLFLPTPSKDVYSSSDISKWLGITNVGWSNACNENAEFPKWSSRSGHSHLWKHDDLIAFVERVKGSKLKAEHPATINAAQQESIPVQPELPVSEPIAETPAIQGSDALEAAIALAEIGKGDLARRLFSKKGV